MLGAAAVAVVVVVVVVVVGVLAVRVEGEEVAERLSPGRGCHHLAATERNFWKEI